MPPDRPILARRTAGSGWQHQGNSGLHRGASGPCSQSEGSGVPLAGHAHGAGGGLGCVWAGLAAHRGVRYRHRSGCAAGAGAGALHAIQWRNRCACAGVAVTAARRQQLPPRRDSCAAGSTLACPTRHGYHPAELTGRPLQRGLGYGCARLTAQAHRGSGSRRCKALTAPSWAAPTVAPGLARRWAGRSGTQRRTAVEGAGQPVAAAARQAPPGRRTLAGCLHGGPVDRQGNTCSGRLEAAGCAAHNLHTRPQGRPFSSPV